MAQAKTDAIGYNDFISTKFSSNWIQLLFALYTFAIIPPLISANLFENLTHLHN